MENITILDNTKGLSIDRIYSSNLFLKVISNPLYSLLSQRFYAEYYDNRWQNNNMAFELEGDVVAIVTMYIDDKSGASYFNMPGLVTVADGVTKEKTSQFFKQVAQVLKAKGVNQMLVNRPDFFNDDFNVVENVTTDIAYIDLTAPIEEIKRNVRKSYKSLINWGLKNLELKVINHECQSRSAFNEFMNFHRKVSGKVTRNDESWNIQYSMLCKAEAFLLMGYYEDELVSASFIMHSESEAYYGVGVYNRELMAKGLSLSHGTLFKAIEICKDAGVKRFILGDVGQVNSKKEENIAKFKSGFTKNFFKSTHSKLTLKSI